MSSIQAAALSRALHEALDTITSDPSWVEITRPVEPLRKSFLSKVIQGHPPPKMIKFLPGLPDQAREMIDQRQAMCQDFITAVDAYVSAWHDLEQLRHSRYTLKEDLATAIKHIQKQNSKMLFDLGRCLNASLQVYGKTVSKHEEPKCDMSIRPRCHEYPDRRTGKWVFVHHPFEYLYASAYEDAIAARVRRVGPPLLRYATAIAQFLLVAFQ